jgi:hypothetical protein
MAAMATPPSTPAMMPILAPLESDSNRFLTPWGDLISSRVSDLPLCLVSSVLGAKRLWTTYSMTLTFCQAPDASIPSHEYLAAFV